MNPLSVCRSRGGGLLPTPKPTNRPRPQSLGTEFPKAAWGGRACSQTSEWQAIKYTQGWIFNHGADRHLINAALFSEDQGRECETRETRSSEHPSSRRLLAPPVPGPGERLCQPGGQRSAGISRRGGALPSAVINWKRSRVRRVSSLPFPLQRPRRSGEPRASKERPHEGLEKRGQGFPPPRHPPYPPLVLFKFMERVFYFSGRDFRFVIQTVCLLPPLGTAGAG